MVIRLITLLSRLSLSKLYVLSDFVCLLLYRVVGYRRSVVRRNIEASFPEKSKDELRKIERDFYHWLCDYFVETLKLLTITPDELKEHFEMLGIENITRCIDRGQNVSAFLGHYGNWEWSAAVGNYFDDSHKNIVRGLIYHPLKNKTFEELMRRARSSMGGRCIKKQNVLREIIGCRRDKQPYLFGYVFDQTPKMDSIHLWLDFLNHDTPVFTGAERLSKKYNDAVVFLHFERPKRGKYIATFELVSDNLKDETEYDVTRRCFKMLEEDIRRQPHTYLWSHNRWKRTRQNWEEWKRERGME